MPSGRYDDHDPYITPGEVRSEVRHWLPTGLGLLIAGLVVLGVIAGGIILLVRVLQPAGNSIDTANQQHQIKIRQIQASANNVNIGTQDSYVQQALTDIKGATAAGVSKANATYDAGDACYQISNVVIGMPSTLTTFYADNCDGENLKQTSPFYQP